MSEKRKSELLSKSKKQKFNSNSITISLIVVLFVAKFRMASLRRRVNQAKHKMRKLTDSSSNSKVCCLCMSEKPLDEFPHFNGKPKGYICKPCKYTRHRKSISPIKSQQLEPSISQKCIDCLIKKPLGEFHHDRTKKNGKSNRCKDCSSLRKRGLTQPRRLVRTPNQRGEWECTSCKQYKLLDCFGSSKDGKNGKRSSCKQCELDKQRQRVGATPRELSSRSQNICSKCKRPKTGASSWCRQCCQERKRNPTLTGFISAVFDRCRNSSKKRGHDFCLTRDDLLDKFLEQRGRCHISDRILNIRSHTAWHASVERKNNNIGYQIGNFDFICAEFNSMDQTKKQQNNRATGSAQWSREKYLKVKNILAQVDPARELQKFTDSLDNVNKRQRRKRLLPKEMSVDGQSQCSICGKHKEDNQFAVSKGKPCKRCKECVSEYYHQRRANVLHFLGKMISTMKNSSKKRKQDCTITLKDLIDQIEKQSALGYYSGLPMNFRSLSHWQCSPERLNNDLGYIPGNVVFECLEFNTPDWSRGKSVKLEDIDGTAQWSREKFKSTWFP